MGRVGLNRVQGGQGYSWTGFYLENLVWTESLVDRVYNGLGWDGVLGGQ